MEPLAPAANGHLRDATIVMHRQTEREPTAHKLVSLPTWGATMNSNPYQSSWSPEPAAPTRDWQWFLVGCCGVFFLLLVGWHRFAVSPSGDDAGVVPLWKIYLWCFVDGWPQKSPAGPGALEWVNAVLHLVLSVLGGILCLTVYWFSQELKEKPSTTSTASVSKMSLSVQLIGDPPLGD